MQTTHEVVAGDARELRTLDDASVELVVTSPPYPMIELWDDTFAALDPGIEAALSSGDGDAAFERMHACLDDVWAEVERVLVDGGIACVNVGDATRTVDGTFRLFPNHVRVSEAFGELGLVSLPPVRWRKPTNRGTKFMGSGMLPPNAYVTLEHEHVLVFRKGDARELPPGDEARYESAYFWEERNDWFSDLWADVAGESQAIEGEGRARSGAFPLEVPYRLIHMYSVRGETVLDPFAGTGTTTLAAMAGARDSVAYELDEGLADAIEARAAEAPERSRRRAEERLAAHERFVEERRADGGELGYEATHYDFPVVTAQERDLRLYAVESVERADGRLVATHVPVEGGGA
ncbi:MAG: site-specific DNA-methyltransferase [Halobacteriales archaeon]|nr:site-specific DNA-methyltransferase [Halobacteriales archaeon]